jgi:hypothetical protein
VHDAQLSEVVFEHAAIAGAAKPNTVNRAAINIRFFISSSLWQKGPGVPDQPDFVRWLFLLPRESDCTRNGILERLVRFRAGFATNLHHDTCKVHLPDVSLPTGD